MTNTANNVARSPLPWNSGALSESNLPLAVSIRSGTRCQTLILVGLLALVSLPGCSVCLNAKRTILGEPSRFSWQLDRKRSVEVYRVWADQAWGVECSSYSDPSVSEPYEVGFKDGFVDYVYAGGSGEPPPVAPREYWNVGLRNPNGHAAAAEWFAGYRLGAQVAREEGYRERALAPTQALLLGPSVDSHNDEYSNNTPEYMGPQPDWSHAEPLPLGSAATPEPSSDSLQPALELPQYDELPVPSQATDPQYQLPEPSPQTETPRIKVPQAPKLEVPQADQPIPNDSLPADPTPSVDPTPSSDVDDVFGPPTAFHSTSIRVKNTLSDEDARLAFTAAIRNNLKAQSKVNHTQVKKQSRTVNADSNLSQRFDPQATVTAKPLPRVIQTSTASAPRPHTIPQSEDQAAEMFQRLSQ